VYRDGLEIASTAEASYLDAELTADESYTYAVSAYDRATPPNESQRSATVQATQPPEYLVEEVYAVSGATADLTDVTLNEQGAILGGTWLYRDGVVMVFGDGPDWSFGRAADMNEAGQVVGQAMFEIGPDEFENQAFLFSDGMMNRLGTFGGNSSSALTINEAGQICLSVLFADDSDPGHTPTSQRTLVYKNGEVTDIGTLDGNWTSPSDMNEAGDVVGRSTLAGDSNEHAFLYADGRMTDLGTLANFGDSGAWAVSENRHVHGYSQVPGSDQMPFVRMPFVYQNGAMAALGSLGGSVTNVLGMNQSGRIYGEATLSDETWRAFVYEDGVMTDLGTLGGSKTVPRDMNDVGDVIGYSFLPGDGTFHAFLYSNGTMKDLGSPRPSGSSNAVDINELGHVLGNAQFGVDPGDWRPFVYVNGTMFDINRLIEPIDVVKFDGCLERLYPYAGYGIAALAINDQGQILVLSATCAPYPPGSNIDRYYLLTPRSLKAKTAH
jgi:probable HAF family extracellular repeat protein